MKRKDYFKGIAILYPVFIVLGTASLLATEGMSKGWKIALPIFFFGIISGVTAYGFLKHKE